jgi:hypothetical protein
MIKKRKKSEKTLEFFREVHFPLCEEHREQSEEQHPQELWVPEKER